VIEREVGKNDFRILVSIFFPKSRSPRGQKEKPEKEREKKRNVGSHHNVTRVTRRKKKRNQIKIGKATLERR